MIRNNKHKKGANLKQKGCVNLSKSEKNDENEIGTIRKLQRQHPGHYCYQEGRLVRVESKVDNLDNNLNEKIDRIEKSLTGLTDGELARTIQKQNEQLIESILDDRKIIQNANLKNQELNKEIKITKWKAILAFVSSGVLGALLNHLINIIN